MARRADLQPNTPRRTLPVRGWVLALGLGAVAVAGAANLLGSPWYRESRLAAAPLDELGRLTVRTPGDDLAQYHLGLKLEEAGKGEEALLAYATAIRAETRDRRVWRRMPALMLRLGHLDEADRFLTTALERWPGDAELIAVRAECLGRLGYWREAVEQQAAAVALRNPPTAADWVRLGSYQFNARDFPASADAYRKAVAANPRERGAQAGLGSALLLGGRREEAVPPLREAVRQFPEDPAVRYFLGWALVAAGGEHLEEGKRELGEALTRAPRHAGARYWLGVAEGAGENWPAAAREMEAAVRWDPFMSAAHQGLAAAYRKLGRAADADRQEQLAARLTRLTSAVEKLEASVAAAPTDVALLRRLARAYLDLGRQTDAYRTWTMLLRLKPDDSEAATTRSRLRAPTGAALSPAEVLLTPR